MTLTPEIEAKGLKAYEQVCAYEELRKWRLPLGYAVFLMVPAVSGTVFWKIGHTSAAVTSFGLVVVFAIGAWFHLRRLLALYGKNLRLVAELEQSYGDQLPWIKVEKHFAELEKLKRDLEEERRKGG